MARPALSPEQRASADVRATQAILGGLAHCISERGYAATTVADIVAAGHVSKSTFYTHFPDREAALLELYRRSNQMLFGAIPTADAGSQAAGLHWEDRLRVALHAYFAGLLAGVPLTRCMVVDLPAVSGRALAARREAIDAYVGLIAELAASVVDAEHTTIHVSQALLTGAVGGMHELMLQALESPEPDARKLTDDACDLLSTLYVAAGARRAG